MCRDGDSDCIRNAEFTAFLLIASFGAIVVGIFTCPIIWFCKKKKLFCWTQTNNEQIIITNPESANLIDQVIINSSKNPMLLDNNEKEPPSYDSLFPE